MLEKNNTHTALNNHTIMQRMILKFSYKTNALKNQQGVNFRFQLRIFCYYFIFLLKFSLWRTGRMDNRIKVTRQEKEWRGKNSDDIFGFEETTRADLSVVSLILPFRLIHVCTRCQRQIRTLFFGEGLVRFWCPPPENEIADFPLNYTSGSSQMRFFIPDSQFRNKAQPPNRIGINTKLPLSPALRPQLDGI